jgi:hypothetical protein
MTPNATLQCATEATDQFGVRLVAPVQWSATGPVRVDAKGNAFATAVGDGQIIALSGASRAVIPVHVVRPEDMNIAVHCPVMVSSTEAGNRADFATDGDPGSRWASAWSEPQWLVVDLQRNYSLQRVVLKWEAFAREYHVDVSANGSTWQSVITKTDGKGGTETLDLGGARGRYLRIYMAKRSGGYGVSLFEVEAYGTPSL